MRETLTAPGYNSIDSRFEIARDMLTEHLDDYLATNQTFIDSEFEYPGDVSLLEYTNYLSDLISEVPGGVSARYAASQAFHFAYRAYHLTLDYQQKPAVCAQSYNETIKDRLIALQPYDHDIPTLAREFFVHDSKEYLAHNPAIGTLVGLYIADIDPSGKHYDVASVVAGITFLQMELGDEKRHVDAQIAVFEKSLGSQSPEA